MLFFPMLALGALSGHGASTEASGARLFATPTRARWLLHDVRSRSFLIEVLAMLAFLGLIAGRRSPAGNFPPRTDTRLRR